MTKEIEIPLIKATDENLKGFGYLINTFIHLNFIVCAFELINDISKCNSHARFAIKLFILAYLNSINV